MIYQEQQGQGADIVLIHGWGMHGGIWAAVAERLAQRYRVTRVDLPGHGNSPMPAGGFDLPRLARMVMDDVPQPATWVGWSLGGMVAMQAAIQQPQAVNTLVTVASLPQFVRGDDWPDAMPRGTLSGFADHLQENYPATLKRFLALQVRGTENERELLRLIQQQVASRPQPAPEALRLGLEILRASNLRPQLNQLNCPCHLFFGERDMLVPIKAARAMHALLPQARCHTIAGAGHAPFLSHLDIFLSELEFSLSQQ